MTIESIQGMALGVVCWIFCFFVAANRAMQAGVQTDQLPIFLKLGKYKSVSYLGLAAMVGYGYLGLPADLLTADYAGVIDRVLTGEYIGPVLFIGITLLTLFGIPNLIARKRLKEDDDAGEWLTPALVYYRWVVLGLAVSSCTGYLQAFEPLEVMLGFPLYELSGAVLPLAAAVLWVLFWGLPAAALAKVAYTGDPHAIDALEGVRWSGLFGYIGYQIKNRGSGDDTQMRKLCPSCMRVIDNIHEYHSLDFDKCPHCDEIIPPVFTLRDFVRMLSDRIAEAAREAEDTKKKKARKIEEQQTDLVQRMIRAILVMALRERATDVHLVTEDASFLVRCRVDGVLFTMLDLPEDQLRLVISSIKVQCNMDISERRKPQDGSFKAMLDDKKIDVRVNTSPTGSTETASLRLLYRSRVLGSLERLGLTRRQYVKVEALLKRPHGLILVTGPTGSGKSTTLYNSLGSIANGTRNIVTLEDPVEFKIDGLTQMQIDAKKNFGFASGLRSILRQDPDVIMVGEIRDSETAKMTIDAAMTGHLVLSTLHTIDTTATIGRLSDLGVEAHRHAEALLLIISQRLVRLICKGCSEEYNAMPAELELLGLTNVPHTLTLRQGKGCERCHNSGYYEREGIYELFMPNDRIRALIGEQNNPMRLRAEARREGMRTLLEDGLTKCLIGRTTVEEVMRVTS